MVGEESRPPSVPPSGPRQRIEAYGGGAFRVSGVRYEGSVLVSEHTQIWSAGSIGAITAASLAPLAGEAGAAALVIIGCGEKFVAMPPGLRAELAEAGIHAEWMDTGAACRTFNVLVGEGRAVHAALLAVE